MSKEHDDELDRAIADEEEEEAAEAAEDEETEEDDEEEILCALCGERLIDCECPDPLDDDDEKEDNKDE